MLFCCILETNRKTHWGLGDDEGCSNVVYYYFSKAHMNHMGCLHDLRTAAMKVCCDNASLPVPAQLEQILIDLLHITPHVHISETDVYQCNSCLMCTYLKYMHDLCILSICRYLKRADDAVNSVKMQTDGAPVTMLAHSAGGWLSRVYLLSKGTAGIDRLVTIGSPHSPPPQVCQDITMFLSWQRAWSLGRRPSWLADGDVLSACADGVSKLF